MTDRFFSKGRHLEVDPKPKTPKPKTPQTPTLFTPRELERSMPGCKKCGLHAQVYSPQMKVTGEGRRSVYVLAEAPGQEEDRSGQQLIGEAGQLLRKYLTLHDFDLDRDAWKHNAVNCRPYKGNANRKPKSSEINWCRPWWRETVRELRPRFIWLLGSTAIEAFYADRPQRIFSGTQSVSKWHRQCIPDPMWNAWVIPMYHPSFFVRNKGNDFYLEQELEFALAQLDRDPPHFEDELTKVQVSWDFDQVMAVLRGILMSKRPFAFDYETNRLRPWSSLPNKIYSAAISFDGQSAYAFPLHYPGAWTPEQENTIINMWREIMSNPEIPKFVQSAQMELGWTREVIGTDVSNLSWDTLIGSHIEDCRDGYTGLKMQAYLKWGIYGYDDDVTQYFPSEKNPYKENRLHECPLPTLLRYNGMDSMLTMRLVEHQQTVIPAETRLRQAYDLFHDGVICMSTLEQRGIPLDMLHYETSKEKLETRRGNIARFLFNAPETLEFRKRVNREPNLDSPDDLKVILFDILGHPPVKLTASGLNPSVDEEVLEQIGGEFCQMLVKGKKLKKVYDYVRNFIKLHMDGRIHPSFWLNTVRTYRSSSSDPNFQNIPKRYKEGERIVRSGIIPGAGRILLEVDYGSMEVRIICCNSGDPVLAKDLTEGLDMHQYWADFFGDWNLTRYDSKNGFVFPLFYGSYFRSIYKDFVARGYNIPEGKVEEAEKKFWDRYHFTYEFRQKAIADYQRRGYVDTKFGHRRSGWLGRNQIINTPVQAAAFHCLLWSLIEVEKIAQAEAWDSYIMAQIHDSMILNVTPNELVQVCQTVDRVMTQDIREKHPWIIVPLLAEFSKSAEGGTWYEMEEFQYLDLAA